MKKQPKFSKVSHGFSRNKRNGQTYNHYIYANYPGSEHTAIAHLWTDHKSWLRACRLATAEFNRFAHTGAVA